MKFEQIKRLIDIPAYSGWIALPMCIVGLPFLVAGAALGLMYEWVKVGWVYGWFSARRFEAYIRSKVTTPINEDQNHG